MTLDELLKEKERLTAALANAEAGAKAAVEKAEAATKRAEAAEATAKAATERADAAERKAGEVLKENEALKESHKKLEASEKDANAKAAAIVARIGVRDPDKQEGGAAREKTKTPTATERVIAANKLDLKVGNGDRILVTA
jgi:hypothetical protein